MTSIDLRASYWQVPLLGRHGVMQRLYSLQKADKLLGDIIMQLGPPGVNNTIRWSKVAQNYQLRNGVSLHIDHHPRRATIALTWELVEHTVRHYHAEIGHYGAAKVFEIMKHLFYFPVLARAIRRIILSSEICQNAKFSNKYLEGPQLPVLTSTVGELIAVDLYGPVPPGHGLWIYYTRHIQQICQTVCVKGR
ncbi:hypothetical protein CBL_20343 [Carabus blaptoides fortunei]